MTWSVQSIAIIVLGVDPSIMGIGPVPAIKGALKRAGLTLKDMDLVEVNEAFAAQYLAVEKELGLDPEITNTNGGAIALGKGKRRYLRSHILLGHPLAASGSRIMAHLTHELQRTKSKFAIGSACIGGGQGTSSVHSLSDLTNVRYRCHLGTCISKSANERFVLEYEDL